jgi:hypothetical protein
MSYADEMKRRVLLNKDCIELRLEFSTGGVQPIMERTNGTETLIRIFNTPPKENFDIKSADTQMHDFVFRNTAYLQLPDCDVDKSLQLSSSDYQREFISSNSKVAVIFLHQISDAAYLFGVDCFDDLHEWLMKSIEILLDENIGVLIKIHPAYFSKSMTYPIDLKYAEHLESHFGVDFGTMSKNGLHPSLLTNVAFIHHEIPAFELSRSFPGFLCITHHGTVAPEMAYLGHVSLVSTASPYLDSATFLKRYSSIEEYTQYVKSWSLGALRLDAGAKESLLRYMSCRNNVDLQEKKLENIRNLFGFTMETNNQFLGYMLNMTRCSEGYKRLVAHLRFDIEE